MTSGNGELVIRWATVEDIAAIKKLADRHKVELGFLVRGALLRSIESNEIILAELPVKHLVGFVHFYHRKDTRTTLYNIVVDQQWRAQGIARRLVETLIDDARARNKAIIQLKCPVDLPANSFYIRLGFTIDHIESGKNRPLNIWQLSL